MNFPKANINTSINLFTEKVITTGHSIDIFNLMFRGFQYSMMTDNNVDERYLAFLPYYLESKNIFYKSFLLGLMGSYNIAYSILRNGLESMSSGVFVTYLSFQFKDKQFLKDHSRYLLEIIRDDYTPLINWIVTKPDIIDEITGKKSGSGSSLLLEIMERYRLGDGFPEYGAEKPIAAAKTNPKIMLWNLLSQIRQWNLFSPMIKFNARKAESNELLRNKIGYSKLNENVHERYSQTDFYRNSLVLSKDEDFEEIKVVKNELSEFLSHFSNVIDIANVMGLNLYLDDIVINKMLQEDLNHYLEQVSLKATDLLETKRTILNIKDKIK